VPRSARVGDVERPTGLPSFLILGIRAPGGSERQVTLERRLFGLRERVLEGWFGVRELID
jgi:hypothetical protein